MNIRCLVASRTALLADAEEPALSGTGSTVSKYVPRQIDCQIVTQNYPASTAKPVLTMAPGRFYPGEGIKLQYMRGENR